MILRQSFPLALAGLLLVIAVAHTFANEYSWYWTVRWFDMPMHFAGGAWVSGVVLWYRFFSQGMVAPHVSFKSLVLWGVLGALVVGLGWEIYESTVSFFIEGRINDILDTVSDLLFDALGAFAVVCLVHFFTKKVVL